MKDWLTAQELAGLPGLPGTVQGVNYSAKHGGWKSRPRKERGGGREFHVESLPAAARSAIVERALADVPAVKPGQNNLPTVTTTPGELAQWQRDCAEARLAFVRDVQMLAAAIGKEKAVQEIIGRAGAGELPEHLQALVQVANAKAGKTRAFSRRTLLTWCSDAAKAEAAGLPVIAALAPKAQPRKDIPNWAPALLKAWSQPQKPPLTEALDSLKAVLPVSDMPSYWQAHRFLTQRMGNVDVMRGRMGARELKNIKPFVRRDTSDLKPTDIYTADGHTFDAEVAHPAHGRPFRPEVTSVIDVATRKLVGWSIGLAESRWSVIDALRVAAVHHGIAAIFYVDNGSGYANDMLRNEGVGMMARLGTSMTHSLPYNSQARGIIERSHQSIWIRAARKLPTYIGAKMDGEAKQNVFKLTRKDIKETGQSRALLGWADFADFLRAEADAYNNRPHRSLPRVLDSLTRKQRHLTPNEMWARAVDEGFEAVLPTATEADDLFRPYKIVPVRRGELQLFSNRYFSRDLEQYHGCDMQVGFDIHDPAHVWVRDLDGHFICKAGLDANSRPYMPQSVVEQAQEKREQGRLRRAQQKIDEIMLERNPAALLEQMEDIQMPGLDLSRAYLDKQLAELNVIEQPPQPAPRHIPASPATTEPEPINHALEGQAKYLRWQRIDTEKRNGAVLPDDDLVFWEWFQQTQAFRTWQQFYEEDENETGLLQQARK